MKEIINLLLLSFALTAGYNFSKSNDITNNQQEDKFYLSRADKLIEVPYPDTVPPISAFWQAKGNSIYFSPSPTYSIFKFDLEDEKFSKVAHINSDGPDGVGFGLGAYYHNSDSVFVVDPYGRLVYLVNEKGKLKNIYSLNFHDGIELTPNIIYSRIHFSENNLYIPAVTYLREPDLFERGYTIIKLDVLKEKAERLASYPDEYKGKNWPGVSYASNFYKDDKHLIANFRKSHNLQVASIEDNFSKFKEVTAKSKFIADMPSIPLAEEPNSDKAYKKFYENGYYLNILYDPYRQVYYRIGKYLAEDANGASPKELQQKLQSTVVILDKNFKKIGETPLEEDVNGLIHIVNKEGLFFGLKPYGEDGKEILRLQKYVLKES